MTKDGIEGMACLTSKFQNSQQAFVGSIQSLTEISIQHEDPLSQTEYVLDEIMEESILKLLPKSNQVPCAIMTFGSNSSQEKLKAAVKKVLKTKEEEWGFSSGGVEGNQNVPILSTREEAVAMGACLLAAGSHGRITDGSGQKVTVSVSNVSSCAVGVRLVYFSDDEDDVDTDNDDNIKVLFDFDRRLPATPYTLELKAAECTAIRARGKDNPVPADEHLSEEEVNKFTGGRMIPVREEAAHAFKLQIVQKSERDGKWISVGDVIEPLHLKEDGEEGTVAIEEAHLQISVGPSGLIMTETYSDRKSIVEATKSARNSKIQYYVALIFGILFVGGFLVKSYVDEKIFERDTGKLLKYYAHVIPGSIHDGDEMHARYMVYKYRNKKARLWKTLENKYGIPVQDEYPVEEKDEEEVVELDNEESNKEEQPDL